MTDRPLNVGLPEAAFAAVLAGEKSVISTRRNPRKDRYFVAKQPRFARVRSLDSGAQVMRAIARVEGTDTEWHLILEAEGRQA